MRLEAFERALIEDARAHAATRLARAGAEAGAVVAQARRDAEALVERARAEGAAEADRETGLQRLEARRAARRLGLEAAQAAYRRLHRSALEALQGRRGEAPYAGLLDRLEAAARAQLGPDARIVRDPPAGGVIAEAGGRRVDYSLPALVERAITAVGADVGEAWT